MLSFTQGHCRGPVRALLSLTAAGAVLALACPVAIARPAQAASAAANLNTDPVRFWSLGRFDRADGYVEVTSGAQQGGTLLKSTVAAGFAQTSPIDSDFAVIHYNPDGTPDTSFGGDGIVATDLGSQSDDAFAVAIQPDGKSWPSAGRTRMSRSHATCPTRRSTGPSAGMAP
jgi:hypothetical protein